MKNTGVKVANTNLPRTQIGSLPSKIPLLVQLMAESPSIASLLASRQLYSMDVPSITSVMFSLVGPITLYVNPSGGSGKGHIIGAGVVGMVGIGMVVVSRISAIDYRQ